MVERGNPKSHYSYNSGKASAYFWWLKHHYRRPSEACVLQWRDWDSINQVFYVRRSVSARKVVERTKTSAVHILPCDPDFLEKILMLHQGHEGALTDYVFQNPVFQNPLAQKEGKRYTNESLNVIWKRACNKQKVEISFYERLEHSSCSQFINEKGGTEGEFQHLTDHRNRNSVKHNAINLRQSGRLN